MNPHVSWTYTQVGGYFSPSIAALSSTLPPKAGNFFLGLDNDNTFKIQDSSNTITTLLIGNISLGRVPTGSNTSLVDSNIYAQTTPGGEVGIGGLDGLSAFSVSGGPTTLYSAFQVRPLAQPSLGVHAGTGAVYMNNSGPFGEGEVCGISGGLTFMGSATNTSSSYALRCFNSDHNAFGFNGEILSVRGDMRVGIATPAPLAALHVTGTGSTDATIGFRVDANNGGTRFLVTDGGVTLINALIVPSITPSIGFYVDGVSFLGTPDASQYLILPRYNGIGNNYAYINASSSTTGFAESGIAFQVTSSGGTPHTGLNINSLGNVMINNTSGSANDATARLHVQSDFNTLGTYTFKFDQSGPVSYFAGRDDGRVIVNNLGVNSTDTDLGFGLDAFYTSIFSVGHGLDNRLVATTDGGTNFLIAVRTANVFTLMQSVDSIGAVFGTYTNHAVTFRVANARRAIIDTSGFIGLGMDSPNFPETNVDVYGTLQIRRIGDATAISTFIDSTDLTLQGSYWTGVPVSASMRLKNHFLSAGPSYGFSISDDSNIIRAFIRNDGKTFFGTDPALWDGFSSADFSGSTGYIKTNNAGYFLEDVSSGNWVIESQSIEGLNITHGGVGQWLQVLGNLFAGFGEFSPTAKIHIKGPNSDASAYALKVDNSSSFPLFYVRDDTAVMLGTTTPADPFTTGPNAFTVTQSSATFGFGVNGGAAAAVIISGAVTGFCGLLASATTFAAGTFTAHDYILRTNNTDIVYIASAGNVGINAPIPNASSVLDLESTTQGFLPPQMTTTQKNAIATPKEGLHVYDLTLHQGSYYNGTTWINY